MPAIFRIGESPLRELKSMKVTMTNQLNNSLCYSHVELLFQRAMSNTYSHAYKTIVTRLLKLHLIHVYNTSPNKDTKVNNPAYINHNDIENTISSMYMLSRPILNPHRSLERTPKSIRDNERIDLRKSIAVDAISAQCSRSS